ncbi:MAG: transporter [Rhodospirillales bacterium]|nr:transporter [Rhodospirillales bacterium]
MMTDQVAGQKSTITGFREWMAVGIMLSGGFMLALVVSAMSPVAALAAKYFDKNGDGDLVAQMIVTAPAIGVILGGPLCGWLIARFGSKRFLLVALAIFGVAGSAGLYLDKAAILLVTRFLLGLATSGIVTAMITMISEHFTPDARARILGYQSATGALSGVAAIFVAGELGRVGGWRAPFGLYLLAFPVLILGAIYLPATGRRLQTVTRKAAVETGQLLRLWPIYLMIIPMFVAVYMPNIQVSFLLRDDGISDPGFQGKVIMTGALFVAIAALLFGWIRKWLSSAQILMLCFVLQGVGIALMGLADGAVVTAIGCAILGSGTGISNPLISDLIVSRTSPELRSKAIGISYTARYSGDFLNPALMYPLRVTLGLHGAFIVVGVLFLVGVAVAAVWRQAIGKPATV